MDGQCTKGYSQGFLNGIKKHLNSIEVDVQYPKNLYNFLNGLPSFCERMKIEKVEKLVENLHDKEETHKKFKTNIKSWVSIEKRCIELLKFHQSTSLK